MPASSPGARHPRPAAAISGVLCWSFGWRGSAPCLSSAFMNGTSAVMAARRNGVAPARPRTPRPEAPRLSCAFTSAPCSTSFSTSSRLLRLPEPIGAGSPLSSSPRPGLRTQVSVWSAVNPRRWSFGSAPPPARRPPARSGRSRPPGSTGLVPRAGALPADRLGCIASLTSAPAFSRMRTTSDAALAHGEEQAA